jgi:hypothetical protein
MVYQAKEVVKAQRFAKAKGVNSFCGDLRQAGGEAGDPW